MGDEEDAEAAEDAAATDRQPDGWHKANKDGADEADAADAAEDADEAADDRPRRPHGKDTTTGTIATVVATTWKTGTQVRHARHTNAIRGTTSKQQKATRWAAAPKRCTRTCYRVTQATQTM